MSSVDKKTLSEIDICDLFISPAIKGAGWEPTTQIRREVTLAPGPVTVRGNVASRNKKKKKKFADYVLYKEPGVPIAVVEAKDNHHTVSQGLQQALEPTRCRLVESKAQAGDVRCALSIIGDYRR
jgi:type I restriction enzyme, R subunit